MKKEGTREAAPRRPGPPPNGWGTGREPAEGITGSEASLQAYREQEQIVDRDRAQGIAAAEISNLSARLLDIVIDCAPILPGKRCGRAVKVRGLRALCRKSRTRPQWAQIRKGLGLLERVNAPIMGIVLTRLMFARPKNYGDYDYGSYEPDVSKT